MDCGHSYKRQLYTAKKLSKYLLKHGIQTRPFFIYEQTTNFKKYFKKNIKYKNSQYLSKYGLYLPSGLGLSKIKLITFVISLIHFLNNDQYFLF